MPVIVSLGAGMGRGLGGELCVTPVRAAAKETRPVRVRGDAVLQNQAVCGI